MPDDLTQTRRRASVDLTVNGRPGLREFSGFIYDEWLTELQGERGMRVYREMRDTSPVLGAAVFAVEMLIRRVRWTITPADKTARAESVAEFQRQCLFEDRDETWEQTLAEVISFLWFGWSFLEINYKYRQGDKRDPTRRSKFTDGRIGWRSLGLRGQESLLRWEFDDDPDGTGEVLGLWQIPPPDYLLRYVPLADTKDPLVRKALLFRTTVRKGNPEGRSLFRNCYEPYYFAKHLKRIEAIGVERDLAGYPIAYVPPEVLSSEATPAQSAMRDALMQMVRNVRRDEQEGALFPMERDDKGNLLYEFKLLSTGGTRQFDTNAIIGRYELQILQALLADVIQIGHEANGSRALASSKADFFMLSIAAFLDEIASQFNTHAFPSLLRLNGIPLELAGTLEHGDIDSVDLEQLGAFILQLAQAGCPLFPNPQLEEWIAAQAHWPYSPEAWAKAPPAPAGTKPAAPDGPDSGAAEQPGEPDAPATLNPPAKPASSSKGVGATAGRKRAAETEPHTGVMVALLPPPSLAAQIALPGGEPPEDLHVTLAYLGDMNALGLCDGLVQAVQQFATDATELSGELSGIGRFSGPEADAFYVSVDVPALPQFRQELLTALAYADFQTDMTHGFSPHITLTYLPPEAPNPLRSFPQTPVTFSSLVVCVGEQRTLIPLSPSGRPPQPDPLLVQMQRDLVPHREIPRRS